MSAFEDWKSSQNTDSTTAVAQGGAEGSKLIAQALQDAWTTCPDGTAQIIRPGQTRKEVCGDQT